mgnify:CR=1 FL=1
MKITIDTKEDSPADIRKVVAMLSKFIEHEQPKDIFSSSAAPEPSSESEPTNAFANMFGGEPKPNTTPAGETPVMGSAMDTPILGQDYSEDESKEDKIELVEY